MLVWPVRPAPLCHTTCVSRLAGYHLLGFVFEFISCVIYLSMRCYLQKEEEVKTRGETPSGWIVVTQWYLHTLSLSLPYLVSSEQSRVERERSISVCNKALLWGKTHSDWLGLAPQWVGLAPQVGGPMPSQAHPIAVPLSSHVKSID